MPKEHDPIHDPDQAASMSDCTGLMPAGLQGEGGTNLGELGGIHPPEAPTGTKPPSGKMGAKNAGKA